MIFHSYSYWWPNDLLTSDLPPPNPNRLNIFFQTESVLHSGDAYKQIQQDFFNLTMSYSPNSDIFLPYDTFEPIGENYFPDEVWSEEEVNRIVERKSKLILLAVSNCKYVLSGRELLVNKLAEYVNITQYGTCNENMCSDECMKQEMDSHMFYLAFENSICNFYHTEKFWRIKKLIVPIVLTRLTLKGLNVPDNA
ncbi:glycosyltransferase family 10 (fucosyltransferase) c-term domain-containing protein [Ditylenchus destructor]|nr:glycosyltransferase family 10 (fucosyltransferase) c-term domain-containing protein [Ditylenchus destructor]